jgi:hypothetical protein
MTTGPKEILAAFPSTSPYRSILPRLLDKDEKARDEAYRHLRDLDTLADGQDPMATTWTYPEAEALALVNAAFGLPFPPPKVDWEDVVHDLVFPVIRSPHPILVAPARKAYPRLTHRAKCAVLALLAACGTREAAEGFMACIREHGWPASVYDRVFTELLKLLAHCDVLFPELIHLAGPQIGGVTDLLIAGLAQGKLDLAKGKINLEAVAPLVVKELKKAFKSAWKHQRPQGVAWRFTEEYWETRRKTACWLDIAGHLKSPTLEPLLEGVLDPVAACHETHDLLFALLRGMDRLDCFPPRYRTWDAFAAANMVNWLIYPTELGREPDQLQKMALFTSQTPEGELSLYVWRFRSDDGPWYAGVSGPYLRKGEPVPLHGDSTFSQFDEWDKGTAEQHAEAVLETLDEWRQVKD